MLRYTPFCAALALAILSLISCNEETLSSGAEVTTSQGIDATVEDNMLVFPNSAEFENALRLLDDADDERADLLLSGFAFHSFWQEFRSIEAEASEKQVRSYEEVLTPDRLQRFSASKDGELIPKFTLRSIGYLLNEDLQVKIGDAIHFFSDDVHIVAGPLAQPDLKDIVRNPGQYADNHSVKVTFQSGENEEDNNGFSIVKSRHIKLQACPRTSVAHQMTDLGKDRLRVEYRTFAYTDYLGSNLYEYRARTILNVRNLRKSGFIWVHTSKEFDLWHVDIGGSALKDGPGVTQTTLNGNFSNKSYNHVSIPESNKQTRVSSWWDEYLGHTSHGVYGPGLNLIVEYLSGRWRVQREDIIWLDIEVGCEEN